MNILITGGTGFVGSKLTEAFLEDNHQVYVLTRSDKNSTEEGLHFVTYNPDNPDDMSFSENLPEIDVVYNLAGASLQKRWTEKHKSAILNSRIKTTTTIVNAINQGKINPHTLINASAVGYYPKSLTRAFTEKDTFHAHDFLSTVVNAWESTAIKVKDKGVRVVFTRFGLILDRNNGAYPLMQLPYRLKLGGKVGSGEQWYSWIHIDDVINGLLYVLAEDSIEGPVNFTAPDSMKQKDFSSHIASALDQPELVTTPAFVIKTALGEMSTLVLDSQHILPERLVDGGFKFLYPSLDLALEEIYSR